MRNAERNRWNRLGHPEVFNEAKGRWPSDEDPSEISGTSSPADAADTPSPAEEDRQGEKGHEGQESQMQNEKVITEAFARN